METIHHTCNSLKNFVKLMDDYRVQSYRAVATSGIREAINREYILEQIRLRTGLKIEVINNSEERLLTYKAIRDHLPESQRIREEGALIVDIGSGGVEISVYSDGHLQFTEYFKMGSLRLREILSDLERLTLDFPGIMEEFIESRIHLIKPRLKKLELNNFIGLGGEMNTIARLCHGATSGVEKKFIEKETLKKLYARIRTMTTEQIMKEFSSNYQKAEILLPSVIIFYTFLNMTVAGGIHIPLISLRHGILSDMVDSWFETERKRDFYQDILSQARYIGNRYGMDERHSNQVEILALTIFDQTSAIHSLNERERLYLQVAALLHDVGKFISMTGHDVYSYDIIRAQNIMGFSDDEFDVIANIARYHADENPKAFHENYHLLTHEAKVIVSKLAAILKLAEALDLSHKGKVTHLTVVDEGKELAFNAEVCQETLLEKWSFTNKAEFFEEVMGVKPVLKIKGGIR